MLDMNIIIIIIIIIIIYNFIRTLNQHYCL